MSNLVSCRECGHNVARSAQTCPSCGVDNPGQNARAKKGQRRDNVIASLVLVGLVLVGVVMCSDDPMTWKNSQQATVEQIKPLSVGAKKQLVDGFLAAHDIGPEQREPFYRCLSQHSHTKAADLTLSKLLGWCHTDYAADAARFAGQFADIDAFLAGFNPWNGEHIELTRWIKSRLNDPDSYDHDNTTYRLAVETEPQHAIITTRFRAANAFGGVIPHAVTGIVDLKSGRITGQVFQENPG